MGFWNAVGRWLVWAVGLLLVILGGVAVWNGLDIIQMERGWTAVIAGTIALTAGILTILLGVLIDRVEALRGALLARRALQVVEAAEVAAPTPPVYAAEPEPPRPVEVPVEPFANAAPPTPGPNFSFKSFGKRPVTDRLPHPPEEVEPAMTPAESEASPEELPPDLIRRFAPPQFRRPTIVPPPVEVAPVPPPPPEPEPDPLPEPPVEVSVEAPPAALPADDLHLPRATPFPPLRPVEEPARAPEGPRPVSEEQAPVEEAPAPVEDAPAPLQQAPAAGPHRAIAQTHEWLEKALAGEESEPGLDWLRQRRGGDERGERKLPSFMRRHSEPEPEAEPVAETQSVSEAQPAEEPPAPTTEAGPSVVGRYSANGSEYTLYANGTIDAQTPSGPRHFASMDELRGYLENQNAPSES